MINRPASVVAALVSVASVCSAQVIREQPFCPVYTTHTVTEGPDLGEITGLSGVWIHDLDSRCDELSTYVLCQELKDRTPMGDYQVDAFSSTLNRYDPDLRRPLCTQSQPSSGVSVVYDLGQRLQSGSYPPGRYKMRIYSGPYASKLEFAREYTPTTTVNGQVVANMGDVEVTFVDGETATYPVHAGSMTLSVRPMGATRPELLHQRSPISGVLTMTKLLAKAGQLHIVIPNAYINYAWRAGATLPLDITRGRTNKYKVGFFTTGPARVVTSDTAPDPDPGGGGGGGGTTINPLNEEWWTNLFKKLFVPKDSTLESWRTLFDQMTSWGPFGYVASFVAAWSNPNATDSAAAAVYWCELPIPNVNNQLGTYGHRFAIDLRPTLPSGQVYQPDGGRGTVAGDMCKMARGLMGGLVYVMFALGMYKWLRPRLTF